MSEESKSLSKEFDKSENDLKALQSVGQVNIREKNNNNQNKTKKRDSFKKIKI